MAYIGVNKRARTTSTGLRKQTLSDKQKKCERRSITLKNTRSRIEEKSATTEKVTNSSKKKFDEKKSLLLRSNKKIAYLDENSISIEKSRSSLENVSKTPFGCCKTPISSKSVSQNYIRKSFETFKNSPLKNITNNCKNKQISHKNTRNLSEHNIILNTAEQASVRCTRSSTGKPSSASLKKPCKDTSRNTLDISVVQVFAIPTKKFLDFTPEIAFEKTLNTEKQTSIRCTRSSAGKPSSPSLKKPRMDTIKNTLNASVVQVSIKPTKKSLEFTPKIAFKETRLSVKARELSVNNTSKQMSAKAKKSVNSKEKSVDNPLKQISAKCIKSVRNQKQDNIKDGSLTRSGNQTSDDINYVSTSKRSSTRLAEKMSHDQEHASNKSVQLSLVKKKEVFLKKKTSSLSNKTENYFSKRSLSTSGKRSSVSLCETQRTFLNVGRSSISPLKKLECMQKDLVVLLSPLHTEKSSAKTACKRNVTDKKSQNKLKYVKKSSGSRKYSRKVKSIDPASIPLDDLMPKASGMKRKLKSAEFKLPGKNTLKRKRIIVEAVKQADKGYEDDIFESKNFDKFQELVFSPTVSESVSLMSTPKFGIDLTPVIRKKTPVFKDCFNPEELAKRRKVAEEYFYRLNKNRKSSLKLDSPISVMPEKKKLEFSEVMKKASKIQDEINKQSSKDDEEDAEDSYFSFIESP